MRAVKATPILSQIFGSTFRASTLPTHFLGMSFPNPVGLAAGFDKDARLLDVWADLGFGFVEIGTVTPRPQKGNPKKRLFRLAQDQAIVNRMGFNNAGLDQMVKKLASRKTSDLIIGANIGKNKDTPNHEAYLDYVQCLKKLHNYVNYFVVNVSSPNTPGLRELQEKEPLTKLLVTLKEENDKQRQPKPILLKIAPDLTYDQLDDVLEVIRSTSIDGIVATNTSVSRENLTIPEKKIKEIGVGGLSGKPLTKRSLEVLSYITTHTQNRLPIISVGGIMNGEDAVARLSEGASLLQVYTGFVYEGPGFVKSLVNALKKDMGSEDLVEENLQ